METLTTIMPTVIAIVINSYIAAKATKVQMKYAYELKAINDVYSSISEFQNWIDRYIETLDGSIKEDIEKTALKDVKRLIITIKCTINIHGIYIKKDVAKAINTLHTDVSEMIETYNLQECETIDQERELNCAFTEEVTSDDMCKKMTQIQSIFQESIDVFRGKNCLLKIILKCWLKRIKKCSTKSK
jgi:hypothetical protein